MEVLVRDSSGYVHRRLRDPETSILTSFEDSDEDDLEDFEEVDESELADISSEAWCKDCFEMANHKEVDL